jgi:predicted nucleic acid-binding protein
VIVTDASAIVQACLSKVDLKQLAPHELIAPPLLWSEATSVIHELKWRRQISASLAAAAFDKLKEAPVRLRRPADLQAEAWRLAERFGWAKTYDAEYVALARLSKCRLLTTDAKLAAVAKQVVDVVGPSDL